MYLLLVLLLVLILLGALPQSPYPVHNWGYYPSGLFGILLIILVVLLLAGRL